MNDETSNATAITQAKASKIGDIQAVVRPVCVTYPSSGHKPGDFAIVRFELIEVLSGTFPADDFPVRPGSECLEFVGKGTMPNIDTKCDYVIRGKLMSDPVYGPQYSIISMRLNVDVTKPEDIRKLLTFCMKDGPRLNALLAMYPDPTDILAKKDYDALMKVKGIKAATARKLCERYSECSDNGEAYLALSEYGLTKNAIDRLVQWYHDPQTAIDVIKRNPYELLRVWGYGWERADAVAKAKGFANDSPERIIAYADYFLDRESTENGNSWMLVGDWFNAVYAGCGPLDAQKMTQILQGATMTAAQFSEIYDSVPDEGKFRCPSKFKPFFYDEAKQRVGSSKQRFLEKEIARHLRRLAEGKPNVSFSAGDIDPYVALAEQEQGFRYTDEQISAIHSIIGHPISVLTGRAGCVSGDTEFYDGKDWKRIDQYKKGDMVVEYGEDGSFKAVSPDAYIRLTCSEALYHIHNRYGTDMMVSKEHTMVFLDPFKKLVRMPLTTFISTYPVLEYGGEPCNFISEDGKLHPFRFVGTANSDLALRMEEVYPTDAAKYCFTVGTHMWLSRYHGSVAVTGNSGKSTVLNAVVKIMQHKGIDMEQCALSGRASSNLTDITGLVGKTIHRLLGYIPDSGRFAHNEANQLGVGVYVIDEASMVGGDLFLSLLQAIPTGSIVVMVGDLAQLDPIGGSAVFKDCIVSRYIPVSELRELHRQARESGIVSAALTVSYGRQLVKNSFVGEEVLGEKQDFRLIGMSDRESIPFAVVTEYQRLLNSGVDPHEIQVLAPTRSRGGLSCYSLNSALQAIANPSVLGEGMSVEYVENQTVFRVVYHMGDRVIVTSNNYHAKTANGEECAVFNGNIGYIVAIASDHVIIRLTEQGDVVFYAKEMMGIMLAYAATVHKFQGTGIGYVIFALDMGSFKLLSKELVYTAITRAKKYCCVIAQVSALNLASRTNSIADKRTWLLDDLRDLSLQQVKDKLASK